VELIFNFQFSIFKHFLAGIEVEFEVDIEVLKLLTADRLGSEQSDNLQSYL